MVQGQGLQRRKGGDWRKQSGRGAAILNCSESEAEGGQPCVVAQGSGQGLCYSCVALAWA